MDTNQTQQVITSKTSELHHHLYSWIVLAMLIVFILLALLILRMTVFADQQYAIDPGVTYTAITTPTPSL